METLSGWFITEVLSHTVGTEGSLITDKNMQKKYKSFRGGFSPIFLQYYIGVRFTISGGGHNSFLLKISKSMD